jgi:CRISPR-associated protein (TIGR02584 family)
MFQMSEMAPNILIITLGNTPQVVTETLWALVRVQKPPFRPDRIILATTLKGRQDCQVTLLGSEGKLIELCAVLEIQVPEVEIAVPRFADGSECADIRTEAEAIAFGDLMVQLLRRCGRGARRVHVSLAGGRKTMSYFAGAALSYMGQPGDELSHVLVEPASLESGKSDFWWPDETRFPGARVDMARIPFWPMAEEIAAELFDDGHVGFAEIVRRREAASRAGLLEVDCRDRVVRYKGCSAKLPERAFALFRLFAAARRGDVAGRSLGKGPGGGWLATNDILGALLPVLQAYHAEAAGGGTSPWTKERLKDAKFHIGAAISRQFANPLTAHDLDLTEAKTGRPLLSALTLRPEAIRIITEP